MVWDIVWYVCWGVVTSALWLAAAALVVWGVQLALDRVRVRAAGKAVLITGCDTGFGHMAAKQLADAGARVFAACLTADGAAAMSAHASGRITGFVMDVTSEESVAEGYEMVNKECPADGLHAVINNAGVLRAGNVDTMPLSQWRLQLAVNVEGIAAVTKGFLPLVRKGAGGRFVNVASVAGRLGTPGTAAYNASKFAVEGLSDALRRELAMWGVRVVIIEPGIMKTPLWDVPIKESELDAVWSTLSPATQALYGREYFAEAHRAGKELVDKVGGNPQLVVDAMQLAVEARWPRARYAVGLDTPVWLALAALPAWITDPLLPLLVKQPRPQALK